MRAIVPWDVSSYPYAEINYANPHAVTSVGGTTYTYDNNGNVTAIGSLDYTWDWRNRLASAERSGGGITSYGYDHTGQRVFKATGTATTSYPNRYYNLATTTGAATTTKHIFSPDGTLLATVVGASTTATTTYLHPDHLGGTNVTTDEDGEVTQTLDYYPYGSQRIATGSFSEQRRFIGEEYRWRHRVLLPERPLLPRLPRPVHEPGSSARCNWQPRVEQEYGRSLQSHLSNPQHLNSYSYAANNPLILIDQSGEIVVETALGLMLISTWALFNYNALQMQISDYEIETMTAYPTVYSPEQISAAQSSNGRSALFSSATSLGFDLGGLISPSVGWIGIGVGYAGVASDALGEYLNYDPDGKKLFGNKDLFETTPHYIPGKGAGSIIPTGGYSPSGTDYSFSSSGSSRKGSGTITVPGSNTPRSKEPVGTDKASGRSIYCWGSC